jgi:hypothetical protein
MITVNLDKARQIHLARIRAARSATFVQVDADRAMAIDSGDLAKIAGVKQLADELRNVTKNPALMAAETPDELKTVWPLCFGRYVLETSIKAIPAGIHKEQTAESPQQST